MKKNELTQEILKELLHYDPRSGVFTWLERPLSMFSHCQQPEGRWKTWNNRFSGLKAGNVFTDKEGVTYNQISISIFGRKQNYRAVRLAWLYVTGELPNKKVLKKDGDGVNDSWNNLTLDCREVAKREINFSDGTIGNEIKLTHEIILELFDYNEETGILLWKERDIKYFTHGKNPNASCGVWNSRYAGKNSGTINNKSGYRTTRITLKGVSNGYFTHRIVWFYVTGEFPLGEIDHKDQNRLNNKISNLRDVSRSKNQKNASMRKDNMSGYTGVNWSEREQKWVVRIQSDNKRISGGQFSNLEDAIKKRKAMNVEYGFSENHGRKND